MNEGLIAISGDSGFEVELFDVWGNWNEQPPFPEQISVYSTATYENILYVFGELF